MGDSAKIAMVGVYDMQSSAKMSIKDVIIANANISDLKTISQLHLAALEEELSKSAASSFRTVDLNSLEHLDFFLKDSISSDSACILLAKLAGETIAYAFACERPALCEKPSILGSVNGIYVIPKYRKNGIASLLYDELLNWFQARGLDVIELNVTHGSQAAEKFWESKGFRILEKVMYKKITP